MRSHLMLGKLRPLRLGSSRGLLTGSVMQDASRPAPPGPLPASDPILSAKKPAPDARTKQLMEQMSARRLEELRRATARKMPPQRWSNRTLIALATAVGASTFIIGNFHGYKAGKTFAYEQIALGKTEDSGVGPSSAPLPNAGPSSGAASLSLLATPGKGGSLAADLLSAVRFHASDLFSASAPLHCESAPPKKGCEFVEVVQYQCELKKRLVVCQPFDRIFRKCHGRPAVEVTHIVQFDNAGEPYLPEHLA